MSNGTESLFWNESWRGADKQRIEKYIRDFDFIFAVAKKVPKRI